jgi:hypothetical protein
MYTYKFNIKYPNVSLARGKYHIHCPEHISKTHTIGAPFFKINDVGVPQQSKRATIIYFDCETLLSKFHVYMHSRSQNHSELMFTAHSYNILNTIPILRLRFDVEGYDNDKSHTLNVAFTFWNPLINILVPMFPLFVLINGLEDKLFFMSGDTHEHPLFALYRTYILMRALEQKETKLNNF